MSIIRADSIKNRAGDGAPDFPNGITVTGIVTATTLNSVTNNVDVDDFISVGNNIHLGNAGVCTATTFSGSGANLTNIPAANITGALPALDGSNLTGIVGGKFNGPAAGILTTSTVGIQTANVTSADLVGAATSMVGLYIGDGHLLFSNYLNKSGGYYITTGLNALNAGPVTLGTPMTLDGTWTIV